jgi:hypothetical protein
LELVGLTGNKSHGPSITGKAFGDCATEAATGACDERGLKITGGVHE